MIKKIGERVGAILSADKESVKLIGYGTYQGMEVPPGGDLPSPKLLLDGGTVVWGCECWWGSERAIQSSIAGREVINVDMEERRANIQ